MPASHAWPYLDSRLPLAIAHRGGNTRFPENTMAAFEHAVSLGFGYIETDVHTTRDGVLVAFHDDNLERLTGRPERIADLSWDELRRIPIAGPESEERIPRMDDVLATWPGLRVNIDPKDDRSVHPLIDCIQRTAAVDRVCVGSFSSRRLARVRAGVGPRLCTSHGPLELARLKFAPRAGVPRLPCAQVPIRHAGIKIVTQRFVARARHLGVKVHVWTVNERATVNALLDLGVDGIMTDDLEMLRQVFTERGIWPE